MFKRAFIIFMALMAVGILPIAAQDTTPSATDFIPADFAGFIQVRVDDPAQTLRGLNVATFVASRFQPDRVRVQNALAYDDFIPFDLLFSVEDISFANNVLPWVKGDMVFAYRKFDDRLKADPADVLMILPTVDILKSTAGLSKILSAKKLLDKQVYRGVPVYVGKQTSIALTASVVFIGPIDLVKAGLDVQVGASKRLTDNTIYQAVRSGAPAQALVFAYATDKSAMNALSGVVSGQKGSESLLAAFGGAISQVRGEGGVGTMLLEGKFDGLGVSLEVGNDDTFTATATLHSVSALPAADALPFDKSLLDMIPRNALLVHSGSNATSTIYDLLVALPMSNFAGQMYGGGLITSPPAENPLKKPAAADLQSAVRSYLSVLNQVNGFNLEKDLLQHLSGNYVAALLPRPNSPVPVINTPFDVLIVAEVKDGDLAKAGATKFLQTMFNLQPLDSEKVDDWTFDTLGLNGDVVFRLGTKDGKLMITTGLAVQSAFSAARGDNRLTDQASWQALSKTDLPELYVDTDVLYNTFFPSAGGLVQDVNNRTRFTLRSGDLHNGLFQLKLNVALPVGN